MIRRNRRSASSMPAAVQRNAISPDCQRLTLRLVRRTHSIVDSHGFVDSSVRFSEPVTPRVSVSVSVFSSPSRREPAAPVCPLELTGQRLHAIEGAAVIALCPCSSAQECLLSGGAWRQLTIPSPPPASVIPGRRVSGCPDALKSPSAETQSRRGGYAQAS